MTCASSRVLSLGILGSLPTGASNPSIINRMSSRLASRSASSAERNPASQQPRRRVPPRRVRDLAQLVRTALVLTSAVRSLIEHPQLLVLPVVYLRSPRVVQQKRVADIAPLSAGGCARGEASAGAWAPPRAPRPRRAPAGIVRVHVPQPPEGLSNLGLLRPRDELRPEGPATRRRSSTFRQLGAFPVLGSANFSRFHSLRPSSSARSRMYLPRTPASC